MKRLGSQVVAVTALAVAVLVAVPTGASAVCNTASNITGSAFYIDANCGSNSFIMLGNQNKTYVGDFFNDQISSILVGHNLGAGSVSNACIWQNRGFLGSEESFLNGSATTAKYINLTNDPLQDKTSSTSTQWGIGSPISTCSH